MNDNRVVEVEETDIVALEDKVSYKFIYMRVAYISLSSQKFLIEQNFIYFLARSYLSSGCCCISV